MRGASERRIAVAGGEDPGQSIRFAVVAMCVLATACVYVACIVLVMGGHMGVLFGLLPWLAATAGGTILVVTLTALLGAGHERLRSRHQLTAGRILELASDIHSLEPAQRAQAKKKLIERLDVTRDALSEIIETEPQVREDLLSGGVASRVERELAGSGDKWHRVAAAGVLGLLRAETSIPVLQRALDDHDVDIAYAAAQALSTYTAASAYAGLLFALTKQRLPAPRIASLLEAFRSPQARELIERRAGSENPRVRYWVAYLLGSLADPRSAPVIEQLTYDAEEDVRANAAESLAHFPNQSHLLRLLHDESWVVRSHAAKAAAVAILPGLAPRLAELLEDRSWWVRQNAMLALAGAGEAGVGPLLTQLHSEDRFARNKAAEALIRSGYAAGQIECLASGTPGWEKAHRFLVDLGRAEAVSTIENMARRHPEPGAQERLQSVLEEISSSTAKQVEVETPILSLA